MCWQGLYYYDCCMPMGCSSSCKTFETFSSAVEWIAQNKLNIRNILHLLDDFLLIAPSAELCQGQLDLFLLLCNYLGIPMAPEKTVGPSTTLQFAGIELDSVLMEASEENSKVLSAYFRLPTMPEGNTPGNPILNRAFKLCLFCYSSWACLFTSSD